uniref:phosphoenolpyruvate--protein phosphotransferase n=1 Tax=uncultured Alphaproteobacteria bacterium TaxID=91750 RepID=A0A6G8F264_9PROT|nr:phosphoenolpyruvate--protein phosphotransferase [uncultured Alphaproteobacteria bacterium]
MQSPAIKQALGILKKLRQITETSENVPQKLSDILKNIADAVQADAATCYVAVDNTYLELFASYGFAKDVSHQLRLRFNEGIIGEIAQTKRSLSLNNIWMYPKFVSGSELEEKDYRSFAGIPIIQWNRTIGVLAVYRTEEKQYSETDVELLETIAMFLAEIIVSPAMSEYKKSLSKSRGMSLKERLKGVSLNKGYGIGKAVVHRRRQSVTNIFAEDKDKELRRLQLAHQQMNEDLDNKFNSTKLGIGEHVDILDAYRMFAKDKGWYQKIAANINGGLAAEAAVERAYEDMWKRLSSSSDSYLKERLHDLRDVADRLLSYLSGDYKEIKEVEAKDIVLVAQTMGPAELMDYDYSRIRGLILEDGTPTMHVAIVAKALNIPVVSKIKGIFTEIQNGQTVAVDGNEGLVYVNPSALIERDFYKKIAEKEQLAKKLAELRNLPAQTLDGQKIGMYINVGLPLDFDYIESTNCDGVGLYRTEIPFMASEYMPDVDKQVSYYKDLMDLCGRKRVIFRSLDVGSDKLLPYWAYSGEANPAIGWRSIRITLDRRAILRKQIKAFLISAVGKELNVMFPMISDLEEFEDAKETLLLELEKEKKRGQSVPEKVNVGLMIEVPSVLFQLDDILPKADFISVGTNDLAQFIFACDRGNPKLLERYDVLSAPFLNVMKTIVDKAKEYGVYCSVCGEMASNPIEALALIGLGYRNLSSSGAAFGRVKGMVRSVNTNDVADYVQSLLKSPRATLRPQLISYAYDHGIEIY